MKIALILMAIAFCLIAPIRHVSAQEETLPDIGTYTTDARTARISKLKETYRISLSDKEKELVASRCSEAQKSLVKIRDRLKSTQLAREQTYSGVVSNLTTLKYRFENKQIDASNLDLLIVGYQLKKANFQQKAISYDVALEDATVMNCSSDPVGFRAALEGVREGRKEVVSVSSEISEISRSSLSTTFDSLKLRLITDGASYGE